MKIYRRRAETFDKYIETRCVSISGKAPIHNGPCNGPFKAPFERIPIRRYFILYTSDRSLPSTTLLMFDSQMEEIADLSNLKLI